MAYMVKEIFYTLQGEGARSGRPAVFCRFAGCNLWSGRQEERGQGKGGCSAWCDTDFRGIDGEGGGRFESADALALAVEAQWPGTVSGGQCRYVVCTGGEPSLQLDEALVEALHGRGFEVAVETNGTRALPPGVDWVCVSPKPGGDLKLTGGDELKLVYPQVDVDPADFLLLDFQHFYLQPMDSPDLPGAQAQTVAYCKAYPRWSLSLQMHKLLNIP